VASLSDKAAALPENDPKRKEIAAQVQQTLRAMDIMGKIPDDQAKKYFFPMQVKKEKPLKRAKSSSRKSFSSHYPRWWKQNNLP
jgi:hypothetical protein